MSLNDLGAIPANTTIYLFWTSHDAATGANEATSNLAVGDILVFKNGSVTQRSSTSGFTLLDTDGIDFDGLTGVNGVSIDLSDNTDAGFYAVGSWYNVILGPITIDTQTVYLNLATFRIMAAEAITGKPKVDVDGWLGTAAATPTVAGVPEVDITHIGGTGVTAAAGIPEVKVASIAANAITATAIASDAITAAKIAADAIGASELAADAVAEIADAVWDEDATAHQTGGTFGQAIGDPGADTNTIFKATVTDATGATVGVDAAAILADTADMQPKLGTPVTDLAADIAAIEAQTDDIGVAGAGLTAVPWNAAWDAEVQSEVQDALDGTIADSVPADGTRPSVSQGIYIITQFLLEKAVSSTTVTIYKPDGTTALLTLTLNDATTPTAVTRAT